MYKIKDLLDLDHTIAKDYLNKFELDGVRKYRIDCLIKRAKSKFIKSILLEHILTSSICFINYYS